MRKQKGQAEREREKRKKAAMEGVLCTENRIWDHRIRGRSANHYTASFVTWLPVQSYRSKGHRPPVQPYSTELVFGRGYEVWALTQFWKVRNMAKKLITSLRRPDRTVYPLTAFVSCFMQIKHQIAQSLQWLSCGGTTREAGLVSRWWGKIFIFRVPHDGDNWILWILPPGIKRPGRGGGG
jgi:hypothetical protein